MSDDIKKSEKDLSVGVLITGNADKSDVSLFTGKEGLNQYFFDCGKDVTILCAEEMPFFDDVKRFASSNGYAFSSISVLSVSPDSNPDEGVYHRDWRLHQMLFGDETSPSPDAKSQVNSFQAKFFDKNHVY